MVVRSAQPKEGKISWRIFETVSGGSRTWKFTVLSYERSSFWENQKFCPDLTFGFFDYLAEIWELTEMCGSQNGFARDGMRVPGVKTFRIRWLIHYGCKKNESPMWCGPPASQNFISVKYWINRDLCLFRPNTFRAVSIVISKNPATIVFYRIVIDLLELIQAGFCPTISG